MATTQAKHAVIFRFQQWIRDVISASSRHGRNYPSLLNTVFGKPKTLHQGPKEAYTTPEVQQIRIPKQEWADGPLSLGANGLL
jgi:hypothetical protein